MEVKVKKARNIIFLKDVLILALSAFGGPQAHIAMMFDLMVKKRAYLTEEELIELNALCQILPGPTSTQTIVAMAYKKGGAPLALLTLLVWVVPAGSIMTGVAIFYKSLERSGFDVTFTKYIQPMALGFIAYAAWQISSKVIKTKSGWFLMVISAIAAYFLSKTNEGDLSTAIIYPMILILAGIFTSFKYKKQQRLDGVQQKIEIRWRYLGLYVGVFLGAISLGNIFSSRLILLFENFYRNGSLIFGGGQVLIPLLKVQFVDYKQFLTDQEFLSSIGFVQAMPGPVFSIAGFIGASSMDDSSMLLQILGGVVSLAGVFLPGVFLIFFVYRFWEELKVYRPIRASLEGVSAAGSGLVIAAVFLLLSSLNTDITSQTGMINYGVMIGTFLILLTGKIPAPFLVLAGLGAGFIF